jgi:hypothetical protein
MLVQISLIHPLSLWAEAEGLQELDCQRCRSLIELKVPETVQHINATDVFG